MTVSGGLVVGRLAVGRLVVRSLTMGRLAGRGLAVGRLVALMTGITVMLRRRA